MWTGLRSSDRHLPVWKSQRRSMLGGCAWAEASREPLPSSARAETWGATGGGRVAACRGAGKSPQGHVAPTLSVWPRKRRCSQVSRRMMTMTVWQGYMTAAPSLVHRAWVGAHGGLVGRGSLVPVGHTLPVSPVRAPPSESTGLLTGLVLWPPKPMTRLSLRMGSGRKL